MEFFNKAKAIRLKSHLGKYLVADDDEETVRQSRNSASSRKARWTVELVEGNSHLVRLKSCHGKYLTASDQPMLLGMTGNKVVQEVCNSKTKMDASILWEPIKEGMFQVKLRSKFGGKFLRANGGTPPWRNSITHDFPHRTMTQDWVLWTIDVVDILVCDFDSSSGDYGSVFSTFSDVSDDFIGSEKGSPKIVSSKSSHHFVEVESKMAASSQSIHSSNEVGMQMVASFKSIHDSKKESGMELFHNAKSVRLRSRHDKYLSADEDEESVCQDRNGSSRNARWTVEFVEGRSNSLRLKSCYGKYLTATNATYLMTGKKVLQTLPNRLDSSVEWEPIREGFQVRLKTRYGNYLRANGGVPPWRNSITHDIPYRTSTQDWVLWDIDVVEIRPHSPPRQVAESVRRSDVVDSESDSEPESPELKSMSKLEFSESLTSSMVKREGRVIYYSIVRDESENVDEAIEAPSFKFKGKGVEELKQKLAEEIGIENFAVCSRNPLNGKLYPLRLHLPPNNATMHVVIVPSSSK